MATVPHEEEPDRPFEAWVEWYNDPTIHIEALGPLGAKCREAADEFLTVMLAKVPGGAELTGQARTDTVRILMCLYYDAYVRNGWKPTKGR